MLTDTIKCTVKIDVKIRTIKIDFSFKLFLRIDIVRFGKCTKLIKYPARKVRIKSCFMQDLIF